MTNVDTAGRTTAYTYEPGHALSSVTRYLGSATGDIPVTISFDYDQQYNTLLITDPLDRTVESYDLDSQDRPIAITNVENQVMTVDYGVGDYVHRITRFDDSEVAFAYDGNGRLDSIVYADNTLEFTYLDNDLLHTAANNDTTVSNTYNTVNRLTLSDTQVSSFTSQVSYTYLPAGQISNLTTDADSITYDYDAAERLETLDSDAAGQFDYTYNLYNGLVADMDYPNGITCSYGYDVMDRITNISYATTSMVLRSISYAYDNAGMITSRVTESGTQVSPPGAGQAGFKSQVSYSYDTLDRLTSETYRNANSEIIDQASYTYDLSGNRLSKERNHITVNYDLGAGNRMTNWTTQITSTSMIPIHVQGHADETIGTNPAFGERTVNEQYANVDGTNFSGQILVPLGTQDIVAAIGDVAGNVGRATNQIVLNLITNAAYGYDTAGNVTNIDYNVGQETLGIDLEQSISACRSRDQRCDSRILCLRCIGSPRANHHGQLNEHPCLRHNPLHR